MRLATISVSGASRAAVLDAAGDYVDLAAAAADTAGHAGEILRSGSLQAIIQAGPEVVDQVRSLRDHAPRSACHKADAVTLLAPLPSPSKNVLCVGRNYADHVAEGDRAQNQSVGVSAHPVFFTKPRTAVIGPDMDIPIFPKVSTSIDYEVELAVVIGKAGRDIAPGDAYDHVLGYTILNDITARDIQRRHGGQYFKGKGLDGSCPIGPHIVTSDEVDDPHALSIRLSVNGERRQDGNTADMIFDIPTLIASLSEGMTLEPGDIIATGTPSGVGYAMTPPKFLEDGDLVVCEIEGIGTLSNRCKDQ